MKIGIVKCDFCNVFVGLKLNLIMLALSKLMGRFVLLL